MDGTGKQESLIYLGCGGEVCDYPKATLYLASPSKVENNQILSPFN